MLPRSYTLVLTLVGSCLLYLKLGDSISRTGWNWRTLDRQTDYINHFRPLNRGDELFILDYQDRESL